MLLLNTWGGSVTAGKQRENPFGNYKCWMKTFISFEWDLISSKCCFYKAYGEVSTDALSYPIPNSPPFGDSSVAFRA